MNENEYFKILITRSTFIISNRLSAEQTKELDKKFVSSCFQRSSRE